ncbi:TPA: hypothetical protein ACX6SI_001461 [Photobacterium damselae]
MIDCVVKCYIKNNGGKVILVKKHCKYPQVPFIGSNLFITDDYHLVERVIFIDNAWPEIIIESMTTDSLDDLNEIVGVYINDNWIHISTHK